MLQETIRDCRLKSQSVMRSNWFTAANCHNKLKAPACRTGAQDRSFSAEFCTNGGENNVMRLDQLQVASVGLGSSKVTAEQLDKLTRSESRAQPTTADLSDVSLKIAATLNSGSSTRTVSEMHAAHPERHEWPARS